MEQHTYSIRVSRSAYEKNPLKVIAEATRQAQAENALHELVATEQLTDTEAGFRYQKSGGTFTLVVWTNSREDMQDIENILHERYTWLDVPPVMTSARGEFADG